MDFFSAAEILASGLYAERIRMNTTSSNLANAQTTRTKEGGPYKRLDPVFEATPLKTFENAMQQQMTQDMRGVVVREIHKDDSPPRMLYDPNHPDSNADGYVRLPNINMVEEMVNLMSASRTYEAGVKGFSMLNSMAQRALNIGKA